MKVENNYTDIFHLMEFVMTQKIKDIDIVGEPVDTVYVSGIRLIGHNFSLGLWITKDYLTYHEYGFNSVPRTTIPLSDIKSVEFENNSFIITKNNKEQVILNIDDLNNSKSMIFKLS